MSAVVRLKRLLDEEPLEAIVLSCKRRKTDNAESENKKSDLSTVFKFVGTVTNQVVMIPWCAYLNLTLLFLIRMKTYLPILKSQ